MKIKLFTNSGIFDRSFVLNGFTMTGPLVLVRNPLTSQEAATKAYVDNYPQSLDVSKIEGGPVAIQRLAAGITGDIAMVNSTTTALKPVMTAGSYSRVTVNAKGQVIGGVTPANDNATPTLQFSQIKNIPASVTGYGVTSANYIRSVTGEVNTAFTGALTLSRNPTATTEVATFSYLNSVVGGLTGTAAIGDVLLRPNNQSYPGYLRANGGTVSKSAYAALYAVIGDTFSSEVDGFGFMGQPWRQQYAFNAQQSTDITGWTTGTPLPTSVYHSQAIVTKNRVYLLGGVVNDPLSSTVYTAPILSDGTLGPWTTGTSLPATAYHSQAIVTKNRVYLLGGVVNDPLSSTVYTAPILSDGTLGPWTTGTSLPGTVYGSQAIVTKNRVYLLGGVVNGSQSSTVYTAPILSDGTLGPWTTGTSLPATAYHSQAIVTKNRVYLLGGYINTNHSSTVYTAPILSDGTLGPWTTGTSLPGTVYGSQAIVTKNRVYLLGGFVNGSYSSTVYTAPILPDGTLGTWTTGTSLPDTVYDSQAIVTKNRVYLLGGTVNGSYSSTVYTAPFSGGTNDYLTLIADSLIDTSTQFKLPDLTDSNSGMFEYYIKAVS